MSNKGNNPAQLVHSELMMISLRDSGYRNPAWAACEFVDNSMEAMANNIGVFIRSGKIKRDNREVTGITDLFFLDDGIGMDAETLLNAPVWGGSSRHNSRKSFGRFGVGGPGAASSMSEIFSWTSKTKDSPMMKLEIDLGAVARGEYTDEVGRVLVPDTSETELDEDVLSYANSVGIDITTQGTVVHIKNPDRLNRGGFSKVDSMKAKLLEHFGLIYRHVLGTYQVFVSEERVRPVDPLFLMENGRHYDIGNGLFGNALPASVFEMKHEDSKGLIRKGKVKVRFSYMKRPTSGSADGFCDETGGKQHKGRFNTIKDTNRSNLIICRAGRQIDVIDGPTRGMENVKNAWTSPMNNDRYWAVEVDFEPELDEVMGVTVNKQQSTPNEQFWDRMVSEGVPETIKTLRKLSSKEAKEKEAEKEEAAVSSHIATEAMAAAMKEAGESRVLRSAEIEEKSKRNFEEAVKREHERNPEKPLSEIRRERQDSLDKLGFAIDFESHPEGSMFRPQKEGSLTRVLINREHEFYKAIWSATGPGSERVRYAVQILLMALAESELTQTLAKSDFYTDERLKWSRWIEWALRNLNGTIPVDEFELDEEGTEESGAAS
jgi:hypothetical protein